MQIKVAYGPLAAVKLTWDVLAKIHYIEWKVNFENYNIEIANWSIKLGVSAFITNFILYTVVGIVLDIIFNFRSFPCVKNYFTRRVKFHNTNEGVIYVEGLRESGAKEDSPTYNFTFEKSKICCLIGNDTAQKTRLFEMLAGERACEKGGSI